MLYKAQKVFLVSSKLYFNINILATLGTEFFKDSDRPTKSFYFLEFFLGLKKFSFQSSTQTLL